jgi:hypothetical protein
MWLERQGFWGLEDPGAKVEHVSDWSDQETHDPLYADARNFYKVEKWTRDGTEVDSLLYAGNNLDKARDIFAQAIKHRPRIRLTIRQRPRVLQLYPSESPQMEPAILRAGANNVFSQD